MRRTNSGAAHRLPVGSGRAEGGGDAASRGEAAQTSPAVAHATLSRLTVLPVVVASGPSSIEGLREGSIGARALEAHHVRDIARRKLEASGADVVLLDGRGCRPTLTYRAIVRIRNAGWDRGIVLLVDDEGVAMVPVASSVGATDFVMADASPAELEARLRRAAGRGAGQAPATRSETQPGIQMHWRTHQVSFEGTTIALTLRELQLLSVFLERGREVLTAEDLARLAWGKVRPPGGGLAAAYVCSLRKKLAWFGGRFGIQTVRGVGYRFVL